MFRRRPARLLLSSLPPHRNQFTRIVFEFLSPFLILGRVAIAAEAISLRFLRQTRSLARRNPHVTGRVPTQ
jgi:hypothetical protein